MKTNKIDPCEKFSKDMKIAIDTYYRQQLSENVRRALARKKMFTCSRCNVK